MDSEALVTEDRDTTTEPSDPRQAYLLRRHQGSISIMVVVLSCLLATLACTDGGTVDSSQTFTTTAIDAGTPSADAGLTSERAIELGREVAALIAAGDVESLSDRMTGGSGEALAANLSALETSFGAQGARLTEETERFDGVSLYQATYSYGDQGASISISIAFNDHEEIEGLTLEPSGPAATDYLDYETKAVLVLPFRGEWFVFWGGRTQEQNYHVISPDQRFAYDIVISRDGTRHKGDGTRNEEYYCFGQPLLAPADGNVVEVIEGIADNVPGELNPADPTGNTVVIDHGNGEYSVMAHFKLDSIAVAEGDVVMSGEELGLCGNSGNSSEPHLHYHLQDGPVLFEAAGLPAFFNDYVADGIAVPRGEPLRGQVIHAE